MKNDDLIISDYKTIFVYKMRKYFPKTELFYCIYYIFKFIGVMLSTHNVKNLEKKSTNIVFKLLYITFFGDNGFSSYTSSYNVIIIVITVSEWDNDVRRRTVE